MKNPISLFLFMLSTLFFAHSQNLDSCLLLYYPFSGNANDASGNGYHGTVFNASLADDPYGNPNSAYFFNGANSYIEFPNSSVLKPGLPVSFAFWVMLENYTEPDVQLFITDYEENRYTGVWGNFLHGYGNVAFSFGDGTAGITGPTTRRTKIGNSQLSIGIWYHVIGVIRGANDMDIYVNCQNDGGYYTGTGGDLVYSSYPGCIGRHDLVSTPPFYFHGYLDEFRYWNRALTQADIDLLCNLMADAGSDMTICLGDSIHLGGNPAALNGTPPYTYVWSPTDFLNNPNISNPTAAPPSTTTFTLSVTDFLAVTSTSSVTVFVEDCTQPNYSIYIPNVFSPNGDGENDVLYVRGENIQYLEFIIYNRWGDKIFVTNDINKGWDGTYKGRICDSAVFTYIVNATFTNGEKVVKSGNVTLVR